jgi:hypothetical protein
MARVVDGAAVCCHNSLEIISLLAVVSFWSCTIQVMALSRSLTEAALGGHDLATVEGTES